MATVLIALDSNQVSCPWLRARDLVRGDMHSVEDVSKVLSSVRYALQRRGLIGMTVVVEEGPDKGRIWHLSGPVVHIGRDTHSDVALSDPMVSATVSSGG